MIIINNKKTIKDCADIEVSLIQLLYDRSLQSTLEGFQSRIFKSLCLNYNKDIEMKTSITNKSLQNRLWIVFLVSFFGLSACSSETEEPATNTESSEMTPVQTEGDAEDQMTESTEETEGTAYYSSNGNDQKADDTVYINENNSNLDKTPADGVQ